ncbi:MAG: hypothetical protein DHS20C15_22180 [Planctomycetota bacterium]|nr:MAG: hypothetical protein DHS20C15_22180 [Planctomycetota bacterium]
MFTRPGLRLVTLLVLLALALVLRVPRLAGPYHDGQVGNCAAMFSIMARNAEALGFGAAGWVPAVDAAPPVSGRPGFPYAHHPPGLPWLVMLASQLPTGIELAARSVALLLGLLSLILIADLAARLLGRRAAWAAGLLWLGLPFGWHHGLLVNYETIALPGVLLLARSLVLQRGSPALAGLAAALGDWIACLPLAFAPGLLRRARWWRAAGAVAAVILGVALLARSLAPSSPGETLVQALQATFLGHAFRWDAWGGAMWQHLSTLYQLAALLAFAGFLQRGALLRRVLLMFLGTGVLNVVIFAQHATGHEHFSLLLAPFVVLGSTAALFPRDVSARPRGWIGAAVVLLLLATSGLQVRAQLASRSSTAQSERGARFAEIADAHALYLFPEGVPLVFLHAASKQVVAYPVGDLQTALTLSASHRERFGLQTWPTRVVVEPQRVEPPKWTAALHEVARADGFVFLALD